MYAELHAKSNFSFLRGASHPEELVARAAELGYAALALTDHNSLAGVVRAHGAAKDCGLKLLIGAEITPHDAPPVVLWVTDRASYGRLARLITLGRRRAVKGECRLALADIAAHAEGLLAGVIHSSRHADHGQRACYRDIFGDRAYLLAELHRGGDDEAQLARLADEARQMRLPLVAAGDVHYHIHERQALGDVLAALRLGCTVPTAGERLFPNAERYLRPPQTMAALFASHPEALARTLEIVARTNFSLDELRYEYPEELAPPGQTPLEHLTRLTWEGAAMRYPAGVPEKVRTLLEHELLLIADLHYEAYFLTVWDLVRFARGRGILCQGRGSAANSAVCYCLGVTSVDPDRTDVLFERFISRERNEAPDIDVDFEHERREEVLQYLYQKYGRERAGMTAEVICYRPRSAVRDVGRALGIAQERIDRLAKQLEHMHSAGKGDKSNLCGEQGRASAPVEGPVRQIGLIPFSHAEMREVRQWLELTEQLLGFPRHLSQHTGGMVMTRGPLCELVPIENAAMPDRTVIQWNKDDLDELGILKVDCLALGMLTAIRKCFGLIEQHCGASFFAKLKPEAQSSRHAPRAVRSVVAANRSGESTPSECPHQKLEAVCQLPNSGRHGDRACYLLAAIPEGDAEVYAMICRADTMGVFQIESRAQMSMLPRLRPQCFYDLVVEVAIVRPGPIQGNMVHPYLRRRNGEEAVEYPNEAIRRVLEKTLGVPLFQEQAMRLAVEAAGFTPGEADQLRRAMGAWRRPGLIDQFRRKLLEGMCGRGFSQEYAESVFHQIRGFGEYGFPESHAASFALLVYVSAWLKHHYPAAFTAALLNSQPLGFYAPAQLVRNVREHGVEVRPADVNASDWDCTLERHERRVGTAHQNTNDCGGQYPPYALRLGLRMLSGLARAYAERIVQTRGDRPFQNVEDFARRTGLGQAIITRLAKAGTLGSLAGSRRQSLWDALAQDSRDMPLFDTQASDPAPAGTFLPGMSRAEEVLADYHTLGLSLQGHPMQFLRDQLVRLQVTPAAELSVRPNGQPVCVAGLVLVRQRPSTAKGITFVTLEDETGVANLIIRPGVWRRYRRAALGATVMLAAGQLQRAAENIHVLVTRIEDLTSHLGDMGPQSRDFC